MRTLVFPASDLVGESRSLSSLQTSPTDRYIFPMTVVNGEVRLCDDKEIDICICNEDYGTKGL